jgi:hypothetical protein
MQGFHIVRLVPAGDVEMVARVGNRGILSRNVLPSQDVGGISPFSFGNPVSVVECSNFEAVRGFAGCRDCLKNGKVKSPTYVNTIGCTSPAELEEGCVWGLQQDKRCLRNGAIEEEVQFFFEFSVCTASGL